MQLVVGGWWLVNDDDSDGGVCDWFNKWDMPQPHLLASAPLEDCFFCHMIHDIAGSMHKDANIVWVENDGISSVGSLTNIYSWLYVRLGRMFTSCSAAGNLFSCTFTFVVVVLIDLLQSMTCLFYDADIGMGLLAFCLKWNVSMDLINTIVSGSCLDCQTEIMGPRNLGKQHCG